MKKMKKWKSVSDGWGLQRGSCGAPEAHLRRAGSQPANMVPGKVVMLVKPNDRGGENQSLKG